MDIRREEGRSGAIGGASSNASGWSMTWSSSGPGRRGSSAAIRLKQLAAAAETEISVCVIEKGSEVGAHILSGAVLEPRALDELIPDWRERGAPLNTPATEDRFLYLTRTRAFRLPTPPQMHNHGNYIISLGNLCRWLATQAEELGVEIYPGFAGAEVLYDADGRVRGVATGDMGIGRDGEPTDRYTPGVELVARETLFAEGCRGSLSKTADRAVSIARRGRSADLRDRHQGIVGDRARPAPARAGRPHGRLAARRATSMAGRFFIIWRTARSRSGSSSGSTTATRI